jgi:hypothetical protein
LEKRRREEKQEATAALDSSFLHGDQMSEAYIGGHLSRQVDIELRLIFVILSIKGRNAGGQFRDFQTKNTGESQKFAR